MIRTPGRTIDFPSSRCALWDHSTKGPSFSLHLTSQRETEVTISQQVLSLGAKFITQSKCDSIECLLIGTYTKDGKSCVQVTIQRIEEDCKKYLENNARCFEELYIPFKIFKGKPNMKYNAETCQTAMKNLHDYLSALEKIDLTQLLSLRAYAGLTESSNTQRASNGASNQAPGGRRYKGLTWFEVDTLMPATSLLVSPVAPLPVVATALARGLASGISDAAEFETELRHGFLSMDQTRKLIFLLDTDPKVLVTPLVGIWISGASYITDPLVWAACLRYLHSSLLEDRVCKPPQPFLLALYSQLHRKPEFFEVKCPTVPSHQVDLGPLNLEFTLCTGRGNLQAFGQAGRGAEAFRIELSKVQGGPKMMILEEANRHFTKLMSVEHMNEANLRSDLFDEMVPRHPIGRSSALMEQSYFGPEVPEVSLLVEEISASTNEEARRDDVPFQVNPYQINKAVVSPPVSQSVPHLVNNHGGSNESIPRRPPPLTSASPSDATPRQAPGGILRKQPHDNYPQQPAIPYYQGGYYPNYPYPGGDALPGVYYPWMYQPQAWMPSVAPFQQVQPMPQPTMPTQTTQRAHPAKTQSANTQPREKPRQRKEKPLSSHNRIPNEASARRSDEPHSIIPNEASAKRSDESRDRLNSNSTETTRPTNTDTPSSAVKHEDDVQSRPRKRHKPVLAVKKTGHHSNGVAENRRELKRLEEMIKNLLREQQEKKTCSIGTNTSIYWPSPQQEDESLKMSPVEEVRRTPDCSAHTEECVLPPVDDQPQDCNHDDTESLRLGDSVSVYRDDPSRQPRMPHIGRQPEEVGQSGNEGESNGLGEEDYYSELLENLQKFLSHGSEDGASNDRKSSAEEALHQLRSIHATSSISGNVQPSSVVDISPAGICLDQTSSYFQPGVTLLEQRLTYISLLLEDTDSDRSMELNALARKYLPGTLLASLPTKRQGRMARGRASGGPTPGVTQYGMDPCDMTMATRRYMEKYGLVSRGDGSKMAPAISCLGASTTVSSVLLGADQLMHLPSSTPAPIPPPPSPIREENAVARQPRVLAGLTNTSALLPGQGGLPGPVLTRYRSEPSDLRVLEGYQRQPPFPVRQEGLYEESALPDCTTNTETSEVRPRVLDLDRLKNLPKLL